MLMGMVRIDPYDMTEWCFDRLDETEHIAVAAFWILAAMGCIMFAMLLLFVWILVNPFVFALTWGRVMWAPKWLSG